MTKPWLALIGALVAVPACSPEQTSPGEPAVKAVTPTVAEPDSEAVVINTAAAFFFVKDNGLEEQWSKGDFIVLRPEWDKGDDRAFKDLLRAMLDGDGSEYRIVLVPDEKEPLVRHILDTAGEVAKTTEVSKSKLSDLALEERIVLDTTVGRLDYVNKEYVNKSGKKGKGRAVGGVMRPVFSPNSRYALVRLQIRWSVHSGPVVMIMEKKDKGWDVVYSDYGIYL